MAKNEMTIKEMYEDLNEMSFTAPLEVVIKMKPTELKKLYKKACKSSQLFYSVERVLCQLCAEEEENSAPLPLTEYLQGVLGAEPINPIPTTPNIYRLSASPTGFVCSPWGQPFLARRRRTSAPRILRILPLYHFFDQFVNRQTAQSFSRNFVHFDYCFFYWLVLYYYHS